MTDTATRPRGRHAGLSFRDWKHIAKNLEHQKKADTAYVRKVEKERDAANTRATRLQAEVNRLTTALIITGNERDAAQTETETVALAEAPFAMDRPPVTPTDLPGTETTLTIRLRAA